MIFKKFIIFTTLSLLVFPCPSFANQIKRVVFEHVTVKEGDTFEGLFGDKWEIVSRINKIDGNSLLAGTKLKVPMDLALAQEHSLFLENWKFIEKLIYDYPFFPQKLVQEKRVPKLILVVINEQFLGGYEYGELKFSHPISSGIEKGLTPDKILKAFGEHPAPQGRFEVYYKSIYHISSLYPAPNGGDPMPWTTMFNRRGQAFHAGKLPGWPASHGCIRLFKKDAQRLFNWAEFGTVVLIVSSFKDL